MFTPTYDDVHPPSGPLFTQVFPEMVDDYTVISGIIEQCTARSSVSWDTMNHWCAWEAVLRETRKIEVAGLYEKHP